VACAQTGTNGLGSSAEVRNAVYIATQRQLEYAPQRQPWKEIAVACIALLLENPAPVLSTLPVILYSPWYLHKLLWCWW
jgi:hypothetical protein